MPMFQRRAVRLILLFAGILLVTGFLIRKPLLSILLYGGIPAGGEVSRIRDEMNHRLIELTQLRQSSASEDEIKAAEDELDEFQDQTLTLLR